MNDRVSVIMAIYNEPVEIVKKSIESILSQSYKNIELIVLVDNPNRKDIVEMIKELGDRRIKIYVNEKNLGLTASLNRAIRMSCGKYIARMDADDISMPERLKKQKEYLEETGYDLVGCDISCIDMDDNTLKQRIIYPRSNRILKQFMRYNSPMPHPAWFGKAELFRENMYIDFPACEDYEFLVRSALRGKKMGNVGEVLLKYRINDNGVSSSKKAIQKTCLVYLRNNYRKNKRSDLGDFIKYLNSAKGKRKQRSMEKYFKAVDEVHGEKNRFRRIVVFMKNIIPIIRPSALGNIYSSLKTKTIRKHIVKCEATDNE